MSTLERETINALLPSGVAIPPQLRRQVVVARRKLPWKKRVFFDLLAGNYWHVGNAVKAMNAIHGEKSIAIRTAYKWMAQKNFFDLMQAVKRSDIRRTEATDPDRILLDHRAIADYNMEIVEQTNEKTGKVTRKMRNGSTALVALDKLGKHKKLWGNEEHVARVVVDIVDLTGPNRLEKNVTPAIEGEFTDGGPE